MGLDRGSAEQACLRSLLCEESWFVFGSNYRYANYTCCSFGRWGPIRGRKMDLSEFVYASCSIAFLALIALVLIRGRVSGVGVAMSVACALTVIWSADLAIPGL